MPATPDTAARSSAEAVAALRYAGSFERRAELRNPDRLAGEFIARRLRLIARVRPLRALVLPVYRRRFPGSYEYHLARTRFIDAALAAEVTDGTDQLVLLGAGYDTRAIRMRDTLMAVRVLEVDLPGTQMRKRALVAARCGGGPPNLRYVPVDLGDGGLGEALAAAGWHRDRPTLFVAEGVLMFLAPAAVEAVLGLVAAGDWRDAVVFDYVLSAALDPGSRLRGARETGGFLARKGERWLFTVEPSELAGFLGDRGLSLESHLGSRDLTDRYLRDDEGRLHGEVVGFHGLALARPTRRPA